MEIRVKRIAKKSNYTIGKVYINGNYFCDSIEDKDRGLTQDMSLAEILKKKVYAETAIPTGTYNMTWNYSNRFKKRMPLIENVPGFSGIRIHAGNTQESSSGCLIFGENKVVGKVINSRATINKFYPQVEAAYNKKEKITITIE